MANEQGNTTDNEDQGSPFARPTFIGAAVLVLVIVLLGVVLAVRVARTDDTTTPPSTSAPQTPSESASSSPPITDPAASVCGIPGTTTSGPLTTPPAVTWDYQGTIAYPQSPEFGPGKKASEGYRYCFQHSPAGAIVMAANALAQGSDPGIGNIWAKYALGEGQFHDQLVEEIGTPVKGSAGTRLQITGFRVLSYDNETARIDLGVQASSQNQNFTLSGVYELVWQDGDWKISADVEQPLDISTVPDLNGYVPWGE